MSERYTQFAKIRLRKMREYPQIDITGGEDVTILPEAKMAPVCGFRRGKRLARSLGSGLSRRGRYSAASTSAAADESR